MCLKVSLRWPRWAGAEEYCSSMLTPSPECHLHLFLLLYHVQRHAQTAPVCTRSRQQNSVLPILLSSSSLAFGAGCCPPWSDCREYIATMHSHSNLELPICKCPQLGDTTSLSQLMDYIQRRSGVWQNSSLPMCCDLTLTKWQAPTARACSLTHPPLLQLGKGEKKN